jgi:hypothetical protein
LLSLATTKTMENQPQKEQTPQQQKDSVKTPLTPNFIKVGNKVYDIDMFTENELREIGRKWTEDLILKAQERKKNNPKNK